MCMYLIDCLKFNKVCLIRPSVQKIYVDQKKKTERRKACLEGKASALMKLLLEL